MIHLSYMFNFFERSYFTEIPLNFASLISDEAYFVMGITFYKEFLFCVRVIDRLLKLYELPTLFIEFPLFLRSFF